MIMELSNRYGGTLGYVKAHWPAYALGYGGAFLAGAMIISVSAMLGWYGFITLSLAALLILVYFFIVSLWAAHRLYDDQVIPEMLVNLGGIGPEGSIVDINAGTRLTAIGLSRRLSTGRVIVIDVYNPQLTPGKALTRIHQRGEHYQSDPRISWHDGSIDLLPLPDGSAETVTLVETASQLWQQGDRDCLIQEIARVLAPGGRLLLAERVASPTNLLVMGPLALRLKSLEYWRKLLEAAALQVNRESHSRELIHCLRADKPLPEILKQLPLELDRPRPPE
jgi:ubiquinone/menaquinone biosynthesis C-methylase UbiE